MPLKHVQRDAMTIAPVKQLRASCPIDINLPIEIGKGGQIGVVALWDPRQAIPTMHLTDRPDGENGRCKDSNHLGRRKGSFPPMRSSMATSIRDGIL